MNLDLWRRTFAAGDVLPGRVPDAGENRSPWAWRDQREPTEPTILEKPSSAVRPLHRLRGRMWVEADADSQL